MSNENTGRAGRPPQVLAVRGRPASDGPGGTAPSAGMAHALRALLSERARPLRFAITGGLAGLLQLTLLALLTRHGWEAVRANAAAFLLAAQLNFALSYTFTWRDRSARTWRLLLRRWIAFHGSIAGMAVLNMLVFAAARPVLPTLAASAAGIGVAAIGNFLIGDRLVFRANQRADPSCLRHEGQESAA